MTGACTSGEAKVRAHGGGKVIVHGLLAHQSHEDAMIALNLFGL